jgi:hypothetical protein
MTGGDGWRSWPAAPHAGQAARASRGGGSRAPSGANEAVTSRGRASPSRRGGAIDAKPEPCLPHRPCPKHRWTAVIHGQQGSVRVPSKLQDRSISSGPRELPKLAVARRPGPVLGPHDVRNRRSSAGTSGQRRRISIAGQRPFTVATLDGEAARRWVRIPPDHCVAGSSLQPPWKSTRPETDQRFERYSDHYLWFTGNLLATGVAAGCQEAVCAGGRDRD